MLKKLNILLVLILTPCLLVAMQAADPFAGLAEGSYDAPIISMLKDKNAYKSAVQLFQKLPKGDQQRNLVALFNMYGSEERIYVSCTNGRESRFFQEVKITNRLLCIAYDLQLSSDNALRKAFFDVPEKRDSSEGMFCRLLSYFDATPEQICEWFPENEAVQNKDYMLAFLNYLHPNYLYRLANNNLGLKENDYRQNLLTVCERIGFEDWDAVYCLPRVLFTGTIDGEVAGKLKSFFNRHEMEFEDSKDHCIEQNRRKAFIRLINKYENQSDDKKLLEVVQFLVENPTICSLQEPFENCFVYLQKIFQRRGLRFIPDPSQFCAYVCALHLRYPDATTELWEAGSALLAVKSFLNICCMFSGMEFLQVRNVLIQEPRFFVFVERSKAALEKYMQQYPATQDAIKRSYFSGAAMLREERIRSAHNNVILRLLGIHLREKTLFEMLLEHCAADLWPEQSDAGSGPSCSFGRQ